MRQLQRKIQAQGLGRGKHQSVTTGRGWTDYSLVTTFQNAQVRGTGLLYYAHFHKNRSKKEPHHSLKDRVWTLATGRSSDFQSPGCQGVESEGPLQGRRGQARPETPSPTRPPRAFQWLHFLWDSTGIQICPDAAGERCIGNPNPHSHATP